MYLTALRSASRPITANLRSIAHRRFTSTATRQRSTRSWKSSAVRLSFAVSIFYYFNTSPVFAEAASQTAPTPTRLDDNHSTKDGVTEKQRHTQAKIETTTHEKNIGSIKTTVPQSSAHNDMTTNDTSTEDTSQQGAYNPDTGEFNWDCSCLGGMAHGPCGEEFKSSFRCFMLSTDEPKGMDCIDHFKVMQQCFKKYPEVYGAEMADDTEDEAEPNVGDEQTDTSNVPFQADTARPNESDTTSH